MRSNSRGFALVPVLIIIVIFGVLLFFFYNSKTNILDSNQNLSPEDLSKTKYTQIPPTQTNDWFETKSSYTYTKSVDFTFKYPDSLIMKPSPRGYGNLYSFYATEEEYDDHKNCINRANLQEDWEGGCDLDNLLFNVSISEGTEPFTESIAYGHEEIYYQNLNNIIFKTHDEMLGGMGESSIYEAITTYHDPNTVNWGIEIYVVWPTEHSRQKTEEITGLESYELFKNILATIDIDVKTSQ